MQLTVKLVWWGGAFDTFVITRVSDIDAMKASTVERPPDNMDFLGAAIGRHAGEPKATNARKTKTNETPLKVEVVEDGNQCQLSRDLERIMDEHNLESKAYIEDLEWAAKVEAKQEIWRAVQERHRNDLEITR